MMPGQSRAAECACWRNVPAVWTCNPGGYQALKKSLSRRECSILDHPPSSEEAKYGTDTVRWFARILVMLPVRPT